MKVYTVLAVFTLFSCVLAKPNQTTPTSLPRLPIPHYLDNGTVGWFPQVGGGQQVRLGEIDGIVSIQSSSGHHLCSGTLILYDLVLTSAHCVTDPEGVKLNANNFRVVADDLGISEVANKSRQIATVSRVHIQPRYNPWTARNDIAILELVQPFNRTPTLNFNNVSNQTVKEATRCHIAGWGSVTQNFTTQLRRIDLEVADINVANGTEFYNGLIPTGSFAAGSIRADNSCLGDPGSALICDNYISGILSLGYGCGRSDFPLVFTQAALSYRWVSGIIQNVTTISPAGGEGIQPFVGVQTYLPNNTNSTNGTWMNGTGTTTRRPGSGGAESIKFSVGLLTVVIFQFVMIQYVMKLIH
jgi:secreted trypsin-like serine protease